MEFLLLISSDKLKGSVGVQSITSESCVVISSSIRSFAGPRIDGDDLEKVGECRDGKPKTGFGAVLTMGVDDSESAARRSGSVAGRGAGDERVFVLGEGVKAGSGGNLLVVVSSSRMDGGCCNRSTTHEQKKMDNSRASNTEK